MFPERKKIGEILVDLGVLTPLEVDRVLQAIRRRHDHRKFGQVAQEMRLLEEEHILAALAVQMELLPRIQDLPLKHLLSRLAAPVRSSARIPLKTVRGRLANRKSG